MIDDIVNCAIQVVVGLISETSLGASEAMVEGGLGMVESVVVDWVGQHLYWVDSVSRRIEACAFDGAMRTAIVYEHLSRPRSLAIDPQYGCVVLFCGCCLW